MAVVHPHGHLRLGRVVQGVVGGWRDELALKLGDQRMVGGDGIEHRVADVDGRGMETRVEALRGEPGEERRDCGPILGGHGPNDERGAIPQADRYALNRLDRYLHPCTTPISADL